MAETPSALRVVPDPAGARVVLPPRVSTGSKWANLYVIGFGLIFGGFAVFWTLGASGLLDRPRQAVPAAQGPEKPAAAPAAPLAWARLLFAAFGLPFIAIGTGIVGIGILGFFPTHAEVQLTSSQIIRIEQLGPIRLRRRRPVEGVRRLCVSAVESRSKVAPGQAGTYGLYAERDAGDDGVLPAPVAVVERYPREIVVQVGDWMLAEFKQRGIDVLRAGNETPAITLTEDPPAAPDRPGITPALPQPEGSKIAFVPSAESLAFMVPVQGLRRDALSLLIFGLIWGTVSSFMAGAAVQNGALGGLLMGALFVGIGLALIFIAIQIAYRKSVVLATRDSLVFTQTGPLRSREYQWPAGDIKTVLCGFSGTTVNDRPLMQLQIVLREKKRGMPKGVLTGRAEEELVWMASVLREFYGIAG